MHNASSEEVQGNSDGWHSHSFMCDLQGDPEWDVGISSCPQETGGKACCALEGLEEILNNLYYIFKDLLFIKNRRLCCTVEIPGRQLGEQPVDRLVK